MNKWLVAEGVQ